ncbi:MAG: bifunctional oligoribonuclease/PAP phosphatase NrnA [Lachnospiraceae bacterium]|jgi:phosphoesterase RecJ-like protein|nr:bifunctional oligoribonuclease/PAP phosphatase NrnA [Lachnospiraceae bacterium]MCI8996578.1 bifunctional oligoribonuclease/PAP phosphatase NrnA [Lachnospiraceae bacterium]MCI9134396.1 bifunctional oligoribonuclease/PAP phosphatase NrnA [Lachnospiraceae bacterium]
MIHLTEELKGIRTVAVAGHIRPDGDCVGSCLAVCNYIREQFPEIQVQVYLEPFAKSFGFLKYADTVRPAQENEEPADLFLALDCGDKARLGAAVSCFDRAGKTICVDHHISNQGYGDINYIVPEASSTCELVYGILDEEKISRPVAEALYLGIIHDTGVFQYACTSEKTMQIAGKLMGKGIEFSRIVEETFYKKTYVQNQILGRAILESILLLDGKCIVSRILKRDMEFYGVTSKDLEGIVSQLRVTEGVEVAIFLYESDNHEYRASLRSKRFVDVSQIAAYFGGGGHVRAAGCTMHGSFYDVVNNLMLHVDHQLKERLEEQEHT